MVFEGFPADRLATRWHQPGFGLGRYSDDGDEDCNQNAGDGSVTDVGGLFESSGKGELNRKSAMSTLEMQVWHFSHSQETR